MYRKSVKIKVSQLHKICSHGLFTLGNMTKEVNTKKSKCDDDPNIVHKKWKWEILKIFNLKMIVIKLLYIEWIPCRLENDLAMFTCQQ